MNVEMITLIFGIGLTIVWIILVIHQKKQATAMQTKIKQQMAIQRQGVSESLALGSQMPHLNNYIIDPSGYDRPMGNIFNFNGAVPGQSYVDKIPSTESCAAYCDRVFGCTGFTYNKQNQQCELKKETLQLQTQSNPNIVSAVRRVGSPHF